MKLRTLDSMVLNKLNKTATPVYIREPDSMTLWTEVLDTVIGYNLP